ncbi:MAG: non-ribosomal peptide synthetase, partial [Myxococcota bacterium]
TSPSPTPAPSAACVHQRFAEQVAVAPERPALIFGDQTLSYGELDRRANQLAHHLIAHGVGPEVRVGLLVERSPEIIVAVLAVLKAGGAYVPLDPMYPDERLSLLLDQANADLWITRSERNLPAHTVAVVLDRDHHLIVGRSDSDPGRDVHPDNLAYVIYTSGSTGIPKGVQVTHRALGNLWAALHNAVYADRPAGLRVSVNAPLAFDSSVKQWLQLLSGHTLHLVTDDIRLAQARLAAWLADARIDVFDCTPTQLGALLECEPAGLPSAILIGGEAIPDNLWTNLARRPGLTCFNVYGPTECTVDSTIAVLSTAGSPTIGRPMAGARVYILDRASNLLPVGVPGEICIGGAGVARGYLGAPAATARSFVPDPFGAPGALMYRSGDLGRYRTDGNIEFIGRRDRQIKLRGFRIELGEIEAALLARPEVEQAAVTVEDSGPARQLVGYVVLSAKQTPGQAAETPAAYLRARLRQSLPEYMVPGALIALKRFPVTQHGKLDYPALRRLREANAANRPYQAPTGETERLIADIWCDVLQVERVGIHDNFFDLGGHSLLMAKVHGQLRERLAPDLSMVDLFRYPTISALVSYLAQGEASSRSTQSARNRGARQRDAARSRRERGKRNRKKP